MHVWRNSSVMWTRSWQCFRRSFSTLWLPNVFGHCSTPVRSMVSIVSVRLLRMFWLKSFAIRLSFTSIGCWSHRTASWSFGNSCLLFSASSIKRCTAESIFWPPCRNEMVSCVSDTNLSTNWCVDDNKKPCCNRKPWPLACLKPLLFRCKYSCIFRITKSVRSGCCFRHGAISNTGNKMFRMLKLFSSA